MGFLQNPPVGVVKKRISEILSSPVNAWTRNVGDDNFPLSGKSGILVILVPSGCSAPTGNTAVVDLRINEINTGYYSITGVADTGTSLEIGAARNVFGSIRVNLDVVGVDALQITSAYAYSDGTTRTSGNRLGGRFSGISNIESLYIFLGGSYTLPEGTIIEYYEYREI